jgi:hypothetical protein
VIAATVADGEEVVILPVAGTIDSTPVVDCPFCSGYITVEMWTPEGAVFTAKCTCGAVFSWRQDQHQIVCHKANE